MQDHEHAEGEPTPENATRFSVIVPTLNEKKYIGTLLESLKDQDMAPFEVIVVDGGSTDGTLDIAQRHGAIILDRSGMREFPSRNEGAAVAKGQILLFTGADVAFPKQVLSRIARLFQRDGELLAVAGPGVPVDPPILLGIEYSIYNVFRFLSNKMPGRLQRFSTSTNLLAVRREAFQAVGRFRQDEFAKVDAHEPNADGNMGARLSALGKVHFSFFSIRGQISSRRLRELGFRRFNQHFLYVLENFFPRTAESSLVRRSKMLCASAHSNMREAKREGDGYPRGRNPFSAPQLGSLAIALVLGIAGFAYLNDSPAARNRSQAVFEQAKIGSACPALTNALEAASDGDDEALVGSINGAAREALESLDTSAMKFGKPERLALSLDADVRNSPSAAQVNRIEERLLEAQEACQRLDDRA